MFIIFIFFIKVKVVLRNVSVVIYIVVIVDVNVLLEIVMNVVNVKGIEYVIKVCLECNVVRFIYISIVDVVLGWLDNYNLNEVIFFLGNKVFDYFFGLYVLIKM